MKAKSKIFTDELKRTFPIYILGMIFHACEIYILYKIPTIIGVILDLLLQENGNKQLIMKQVYELIWYSVIMIFPRMIYRTLYFTNARTSDTYLRKKVIEHLQNVKPEYFDREDKGVFLAYMSKELLSIRKFFGDAFFFMAKLVIAPIIGLFIIGNHLNSILALTLIPIFPIALFVLLKLYQKFEKIIEKERLAYVDLSRTIEQNTAGFHLIKLYNEQENQKKKFCEINTNIYKVNYADGDVINQIQMVTDILYGLCYSLGFALGLILIQKRMLTVGELTAYISCIGIVISEIVNSIEPLMNGFAYFKQANKRYQYFFNLDTYSKEGKKLEDVEKIEIKNLSYTYGNHENFALRQINMTIQKGEKIGIVGKVGSGKTTLMNIMAGFYEVSPSQVLLNYEDINEYNRDSIFEKIGYATQKSIITDDTIKNNIDMKEEAKQNEIEEVSRKASIYKDIQNMQDGLETRIGENGVKISGGQKQRIQIARNLLKVRSVNIFDDTLSALDIQTEKQVIAQIKEQTQGNILIVVSNKISMMEEMDKVYVLLDGEIVASGTHAELLQNNEIYKELSDCEKAGDIV